MQSWLEELRRTHFPVGRNQVPAHATLFHALPPDGADDVVAALAPFGVAAFRVDVTGLRSLGRGVAFTLGSPALAERRAAVARRFTGRLGTQDSQPFRPHVTVQNKVTPEAARQLHASLAISFAPIETEAAGFHLWRYRGGPWDPVLSIDLTSAKAADPPP